MDFKDYYKVLGIEPSATAEEIKRAYKKLARKYHPDVSDEADAQSRFQEVSEAYEVLRNADKRAEYDELRAYVNNPNQFRGTGGQFFNFDGDFSAEDQFADLLRSIFGDQGRFSGFGQFEDHRPRQPSRPTTHALSVSLEEAYRGASRQLRIETPGNSKTISVKVPKGIKPGTELRLRGQAPDGGDLYLKIELEPHAEFSIEGDSVMLTLPVSPWEAALGTTVPVRTLGGTVNLKVPPNSQSGRKLRLKGRGLGGGDQIVTLKIVNPDVSMPAAKAAFETLRDSFSFDPRKQSQQA